MAELVPDSAGAIEPDAESVLGPLAWMNWRAFEVGQPARTSQHSGIQIVPLWVEIGLYSDAHITGELVFGPYSLLLTPPPRLVAEPGHSELALILRSDDHLLDGPTQPVDLEEQDVAAYAGGDLGRQIASLLALALSRRVRTGGPMRHGYEGDPRGTPRFDTHRPPALGAPPWRSGVLPGVAQKAYLPDAERYLEAFVRADAGSAVALMRAAHQYADALWWADSDPRIAWIKLFGALEAAADLWDAGVVPDPIDQLRRRHPSLCRRLDRDAPDAVAIVANSLSRTLGAESKMIAFVLAHLPEPREPQPAFGALDQTQIEASLRVLYDHRSRELHGGIPFPEPLCEAPVSDDDGVPVDVYPAMAASAQGGSWPAARLPMYLHSFAFIVGGALRTWWLSLAVPDSD